MTRRASNQDSINNAAASFGPFRDLDPFSTLNADNKVFYSLFCASWLSSLLSIRIKMTVHQRLHDFWNGHQESVRWSLPIAAPFSVSKDVFVRLSFQELFSKIHAVSFTSCHMSRNDFHNFLIIKWLETRYFIWKQDELTFKSSFPACDFRLQYLCTQAYGIIKVLGYVFAGCGIFVAGDGAAGRKW